jgi:NAD-dependent SIR2 family protein deacetylase
MMTRYGLSAAQFRALLEAQSHRCAICHGKPETWHVDHDHETRVVRGLLCNDCNLGIGRLREDPDILRAAISYLGEHHQQRLRLVD